MPERLPNLIIAGVPKAATTSMFAALAGHPDIHPSDVKETHYYLPLRYAEPMQPLSQYAKHFREWAGQPVIMEATPGYFYGGEPLVKRIVEDLGSPKILLMLRDPVRRAISFYRWQQSRLELPVSLTFVDYVRRYNSMSEIELSERKSNPYWGVHGGFYAKWMPLWCDTFGDRLRVVFFEDFVSNPQRVLDDVCTWLRIRQPKPLDVAPSENTTITSRNRLLHRAAFALSDALDPLFRGHPELKTAIRRTYLRMNGATKQTADIPDSLVSELKARFADANHELEQVIGDRAMKPIPAWITQ